MTDFIYNVQIIRKDKFEYTQNEMPLDIILNTVNRYLLNDEIKEIIVSNNLTGEIKLLVQDKKIKWVGWLTSFRSKFRRHTSKS